MQLPVHSSRGPHRRAAVATELAVFLPFLSFIFIITVDFARVFYYFVTVDSCARNGALFAAAQANGVVWQGTSGQVNSVADAAVADAGSLNPALDKAKVTVANANDADGNPVVQVTVKYTFSTITNYPGVPSQVDLVRTAQMRVIPSPQ